MTTAIYPGSFDPVTLGHLDIIQRGAHCFDQVIVCVMVNSAKHGFFTPEERVNAIRKAVAHLPNVTVDASCQLLADYAKAKGAQVIVKGLRAVADFESEVQMAQVNRMLNPQVETMFFPSSQKFGYLSSSIVKEMVRYGVDLTDFLPGEVIEDVERKAEEYRRMD